jgi:hypothetical protein
MPMIEITERDILRGKIVTPGWYRVRVDTVGEAPAKDQTKGPSTNYPVEGTIIKNADDGSTEFAGVPLDWNFNSKATGFTIPFLSAFGVEVKPGRVDLKAAEGRELDVFVENDTYNNRLVNRVNHKYRAPKE